MIRVLLIGAGFLIVTIALLLLQPGLDNDDATYANAPERSAPVTDQVTRSNTNLTSITPVSAQPELPQGNEPATMISNILNGLSTQPTPTTQRTAAVPAAPKLNLGSSENTGARELQLKIIQALQ